MSAQRAGPLLDSAATNEQRTCDTEDTLMNSIPSTGPTPEGIPTVSVYESMTYQEMLDAMQVEADLLRFTVQRRRKALRRQKRRARLARCGRREVTMAGLGAVLLAAGVTLLVLGHLPVGMGFIDLALKVWCDAVFAPRPPAAV
ncbi:hypothetical protein [Streptomyces sp. NPDC085529]|uniref:hypothetical protein n=1 Tax=Streptomyces sp. NPDC085529 TaxID=3365729 RepID=UPI0037CF622D